MIDEKACRDAHHQSAISFYNWEQAQKRKECATRIKQVLRWLNIFTCEAEELGMKCHFGPNTSWIPQIVTVTFKDDLI